MNIDQAIAVLLAKHQKETEEKLANESLAPVVTRNAPTTAKKAKKVEHVEKARVSTRSTTGANVFGLVMPEVGSLTSAQFIMAVRDAGKRCFKTINAKGEEIIVRKLDQSKVRDDMIQAIAGYCGYDSRGNFGEQDLAARAKAAREIGYGKTNGQTREQIREAVKHLGTPVVFGVCNHQAKRAAELRAQEVVCVEEMIEKERVVESALRLSTDPRLTPKEQEECRSIYNLRDAELTIIKAKLAQIRSDIELNVSTVETFER